MSFLSSASISVRDAGLSQCGKVLHGIALSHRFFAELKNKFRLQKKKKMSKNEQKKTSWTRQE